MLKSEHISSNFDFETILGYFKGKLLSDTIDLLSKSQKACTSLVNLNLEMNEETSKL
jgi:hypothetical protein